MLTETQNPTQTSNTEKIMGLPVDIKSCFTNEKNIYKPRFEKRQRKLLEKLSCLTQFLDKDENILLVAPGCSSITLFEQLFTGWIIFYLKRCLFVFTNKRVLHIPTKSNLSFRHSLAQICYADCLSLSVKGSKLIAKYANGKTEKFSSIIRGDGKKITSILQSVAFDGPQNVPPQRTHLCPKCTSPLVENNFTCPSCGLEFKNKQKARLYSLVFPGGGYFYTRHPFLGVSDACAETYLTFLVIFSLIGVFSAKADSLFAAVFIGLILAIEKALTVSHSNGFVAEYIPIWRKTTTLTKSKPSLEAPSKANKPEPTDVLRLS